MEELKKQLAGLVGLAETVLSERKDGWKDKYTELEEQITDIEMQIKAAERLAAAKKLTADPPPANGTQEKKVAALPLTSDDGGPTPVDKKAANDPAALQAKAVHTLNVMRYGGDLDEHKTAITREILGADYIEVVSKQEAQFKAYLRYGEMECLKAGIDLSDLRRQVWHVDDMMTMLKADMGIAEIKNTMVEGTDVLGGYAIPPQRSRQILRKVRGLTAIRSAGALVITTPSNSIEWLKVRPIITGGSDSDSYPSGLRGAWGHETQSPAEKNYELALELIPVHVYTYKVPMSVSLLEDAPNVVTILVQLVADTLAIDEDTAFVTGDGANKPRGLLPGSANDFSFTELNSTVADNIEVSTVKRLRRKIASQYRSADRAAWVWASGTAEIVETFQDGQGRFYYEYTEAGDRFLRHRVNETEAMPAIAANAFPILFGDFSGYAIVERLGLAMVRFMDSNTSVNKVEFQIRRRIGGDVIEPWKFAVQKCAV
jgi:HK97 family phage major capsid protein